MKNQTHNHEELVEKVLQMLEPMNDVTIKKAEDRIYLCKANAQFGFIKGKEVHLLGTDGNYNILSLLEDRQGNFLQDHLLTAATESWWVASGKKHRGKVN